MKKPVGKTMLESQYHMHYDCLTQAEFYAARGYEKPKTKKKKNNS